MTKQVRQMHWLVAVFLSICTASSCSAWFEDKFEEELAREAGAVKLLREVDRGDYGVLTAGELKTWLDEGREMLLVDTMPYEDSYRKGHIPGAVHFLFPIPEMTVWEPGLTDGETPDQYGAVLGGDREKVVVIYCGFVKCTRSHNGAIWAKKLGYRNVYRFPGGIHAWKGAGYPLEKME